MSPSSLPFQPKLPARISGVVFWVLVLISLVVAVYILNKLENEIDDSREKHVALLEHAIQEVIEHRSQHEYDPVQLEADLGYKINYYKIMMDYSSVHLLVNGQSFVFGQPNGNDDDDDEIMHEMTHRSKHGDIKKIELKVYLSNKEKIVADIRKNMLLGIGVGIFVIGFFLRYVLNIMLTRPFISMLNSAKNFTLGDETIRFDEARQDEFGYLGRFINHALESILDQQEALVGALERASASEIALSIEKERAEVTLYAITDSVMTVDRNGVVVYINPAAEKLLECTLAESIGRPLSEILDFVDEFSVSLNVGLVKACYEKGGMVTSPEYTSLLNKSSNLIAIEASAAPMKNEKGELLGAVVVIQDVSHARQLTQQLSYQASHDALTGLYNRRKFDDYLQDALMSAEYEDRRHVLLYLDLDQFKIVNDTCGHIAGDELLQQLPLIFNKTLRSGDVVARLGGDEFGILLENCSLDKAVVIAEKVRENIKQFRFVWKDKTFEIGASIGLVIIDSEHTDINSILSEADIACYAAKDAGRNRVHIYEESDLVVAERHGEMRWTSRITKAIEEDRFILYQQDIINIKTSKVEHVEILIRMIAKDGSIILPGAFFPAAERFNLMVAIDRWVISHTFELMDSGAFDEGVSFKNTVAINLSGDSLSDDSLLEFIYSEQEKYNVSLDRICFEITETVAISNLSQAVKLIEELKRHGCKFSLDDFGSGLSSFAYLKRLPVDYLKIDGSFVKDVARDEIDRAMVKSIQQVAEAMGLTTIAEWVEDEEILSVLRDLGVDFAQGNHLMTAQPIA